MQLVNIGFGPDDGTGDPLRTAFGKINTNFSRLQQLQADSYISSNASSIVTSTSDYYVGVNHAAPVTITLHEGVVGQHLIIKDESGACATNPISIVGIIDNSANTTLSINNGALSLIYSNGWRSI